MIITDWGKYAPYFKKEEFDCKETGENKMSSDALDLFLEIRKEYAKGMHVSSGFRSIFHSAESGKDSPGAHAQGMAADFYIDNASDRYKLVSVALAKGAKGVGVSKNFVHIDSGHAYVSRPAMWSY